MTTNALMELADRFNPHYSTIIKALAAMVNVHTPDKLFDLDAIPRDPIMEQVTRIRSALDAYSKELRTAAAEGGEAVAWWVTGGITTKTPGAPNGHMFGSYEAAEEWRLKSFNPGNCRTEALYTHPPEVARDAGTPAEQSLALQMLVAAGHVTQGKVDEALSIAHSLHPTDSGAGRDGERLDFFDANKMLFITGVNFVHVLGLNPKFSNIREAIDAAATHRANLNEGAA